MCPENLSLCPLMLAIIAPTDHEIVVGMAASLLLLVVVVVAAFRLKICFCRNGCTQGCQAVHIETTMQTTRASHRINDGGNQDDDRDIMM